ncbi:MAG TPA: FAD-dependent oxidoreductase [Candidatus Limnocylindrales bacterium]|nr:FAD-dependent oxidoreductase [Candidatus Limnocylindrales bacterium]
MTRRVDVVIIGAGIVGLSAACTLLARGARVMVADGDPLGGQGSRAAAGVAIPSLRLLADPVLSAFVAKAAGALHADLDKRDAQLRMGRGVIRPAWSPSERDQLETAAAVAPAALGAWHEAGELAQREPVLEGAQIVGGFACADGYVVDTSAYLDSLLDQTVQAGATIVRGCQVHEVTGGVPAKVQAGEQTWEAGAVIVAAGPWSARIPGLPALPVYPLRGQMVELADDSVRLNAIVSGRTYLCHAPGGRFGVGATEERAGFAPDVTAAGLAYLLGRLVSRFPRLRQARYHSCRSGLRASTPDGRPLIGAVPGAARVFVGTGHGGQGILTGTYTGQALADLVDQRRPDIPQEFDPARPMPAGG